MDGKDGRNQWAGGSRLAFCSQRSRSYMCSISLPNGGEKWWILARSGKARSDAAWSSGIGHLQACSLAIRRPPRNTLSAGNEAWYSSRNGPPVRQGGTATVPDELAPLLQCDQVMMRSCFSLPAAVPQLRLVCRGSQSK
ncbi:hypothetical protein VTK73DRAFT_3700 [Phialemonium thermophilum]|uniref:Uncharacterized protein n=1 Tax=Phialemonium thermophilum TaxID=223376 RepID=A0ABR3VFN5_9PEZI